MLITISVLINVSFSIGFSSMMMFVNNSVAFDKLASINGVVMVTASMARYALRVAVHPSIYYTSFRTIGPIVFGSLFSVSLSDATLDFGFPVLSLC